MNNQRLSLEEFKTLFGDKFESREEMLAEYESFLSTFEQLDKAAVPELSAGQKAEIFREAWQDRPRESPWIVMLLNLFRRCFRSSTGILPVSSTGVSPVKSDKLYGQDGPATHGQDAHATIGELLKHLLRQPALTFALGIVIGCIIMSAVRNKPIDLAAAASADELLEVERTKYSRIYTGKIVDDYYSEFENPRIVLEQAGEDEPPQRTLYGTLDNGEIYVVWNL